LTAGKYSTSFGVKSNTATVTVGVSVTMNAPATPTPTPTPTPSGTTIYVSTTGLDGNIGTQTNPVRTIQRAVQLAAQLNSTGQAGLILVAAGTYRESVDLGGQATDAALTIQGAGTTTVLTGADVWSTGWTATGDGSFVHAWPYKWGMKAIPSGWGSYWTSGGNGPLRDVLRRSEMVYVNGSPLRGVLSVAETAAAGTFYVDEAASLLHVRLPSGVSLSGATIEVGIRQTPLRINARRNVTLRNFAVMRNRGAVQDVALSITNSRNIALEDMTLRWFAYGALATGYNTTLRFRRLSIIDNGVMAVSDHRDIDVLIEDSDISRNNWRGWAAMHRGWDVVLKWGGIRDGIVRRTKFVSNWGNGFYADQDNKRLTVEYSLMASNYSKGVSLEKNQGPIVINGNRICNNLEGGMVDVQSDRVTVKNNQIFGNKWNLMFSGFYAGQTFPDWQTGTSYTAHSLYWTITGNTIVGNGTDGWLFWHTDYLAPGAWADTRNSMISFDYNTWYHSARTTAFKLPQGSVTFTTFRSDVQLANSAFESHSAWGVPTVSCTMP
jgi:pectate lyase